MNWTHVVRVMSVRRASRPLHLVSAGCAARYLHRLGLRCQADWRHFRDRIGYDPVKG